MSKRREWLSFLVSGIVLAALLAVCFWLTSLDFGDFRPEDSTVTFVLWAMSTCIVIGTLALAFVVFRHLLKLYVERRQNKPGSRIKTKLVLGVVAVSIVPVTLHVSFSIVLLNRNFDKWFSQPTVDLLESAQSAFRQANQELLAGLRSDAARLASAPEAAVAIRSGLASQDLADQLRQTRAHYLALTVPDGQGPPIEIRADENSAPATLGALAAAAGRSSGTADGWLYATVPVLAANGPLGALTLGRKIPEAILAEQAFMRTRIEEWQELEGARPLIWRSYMYILALISLSMLFIALWLALFASKQITRPIEALVTATGELASGHLHYRVQTPATDELASLVDSFNRMSQALETKTGQLETINRDLADANTEIEERRRFIDTILDSITPGVVSVARDGAILKFNESASRIAAPLSLASAESLAELLEGTDRTAFEHLFKTASRTGVASRDFEIKRMGREKHLGITVSSLGSGEALHGFVVVLEDTTELWRAQRSQAWQEVAQRLAHEIKNPLTPVALAAGRIDRLLERHEETSETEERKLLRERLAESTRTIQREVQSLKTLVDHFSDLARFPSVRPETVDLNSAVRDAVRVFDGRLSGIELTVEADARGPLARLDPDPFKRVLVNLIDNAAEVVQDCWVKEIVVSTRSLPESRTVEITVADSGPGISPEDKEKLFLPYFSTKDRGTGLGLPIVRDIVRDHQGQIRVEDNQPSGARFIIELPAAAKAPALQESAA